MTSTIRVLIADDMGLVVEALADLLSSDPSIELVGAAADADEAIALARQHAPDVVLVDVRMPGGGGPRAVREIRKHRPRTRLVALSAYEDRATVMEMVRAGACGYLVKGAEPERILNAVRQATSGDGALSGEVAARVIEELSGQFHREEQRDGIRRDRLARTRTVIAGEGLSMVHQPIVELRSGMTVGSEALARFADSPVRGPDVWFAEAYAVGLRTELEVVALRRALEHLAHMGAEEYISVNLSPRTTLVSGFAEAFARMSPERVVLEITEHARIRDYDALNEALGAFRRAEGRLAVDDAGAGFASLRHILDLSPDIIKLDSSLVRGIHCERRRRALATALITFAREIDAGVVAEGVETEAELDALIDLGVTFGQGYHLGPPVRCELCDPEDAPKDLISSSQGDRRDVLTPRRKQ